MGIKIRRQATPRKESRPATIEAIKDELEATMEKLLQKTDDDGNPILEMKIDPVTGEKKYRILSIQPVMLIQTKNGPRRATKKDIEEREAEQRELSIEAEKLGQPVLLTRIDAKTGEVISTYNRGEFGTVTPQLLTIIYDLFSAIVRLSKDRDWLPVNEVIDNISNMEYIAEWRLITIEHALIGILNMGILETRGDHRVSADGFTDMEVRLVSGRKANVIKQWINVFNRPTELIPVGCMYIDPNFELGL